MTSPSKRANIKKIVKRRDGSDPLQRPPPPQLPPPPRQVDQKRKGNSIVAAPISRLQCLSAEYSIGGAYK